MSSLQRMGRGSGTPIKDTTLTTRVNSVGSSNDASAEADFPSLEEVVELLLIVCESSNGCRPELLHKPTFFSFVLSRFIFTCSFLST